MSAQPHLAGSLDPTFGDSGKFFPDFPGAELLSVSALKTATDGKIYFAGVYSTDGFDGYMLGRLGADGAPDLTFGNGGLVTDSFAGHADSKVSSILLQEDGKILLLGSACFGRLSTLARYNHNGTLDVGFGTGGQTIIDSADDASLDQQDQDAKTNAGGTSAPAQLLPDGKILLCSYQTYVRPFQGRIYRLQSNGALDSSFNGVGYIVVSLPDGSDSMVYIRNVLVQADGKYLACGNYKSAELAFVARYTPDGRLDQSFGDKGFVSVKSDSGKLMRFIDMALQPNQRILAIGTTLTEPFEGLMVSLEPDGSPNIQFNSGRPLYTRLDNKQTEWGNAVLQADGKILVSGAIENQDVNFYYAVLARYDFNGTLDPAFNDTGWLPTGFSADNQNVAMTSQRDGRILIAARDKNSRPVILRYLP
ncbi:hypothetical protein ACIQU2_18195 [Pseudomonas sp. NPDC098740]|uniref:hypothetical protein n=1 Tax=Pseudomonas sp. NPDC098740 TaxID=3364486 RepID=UPI00383BC343